MPLQNLLSQASNLSVLLELWNLVDDVSLVLKDRQGRFIFANRQALLYFRVADVEAIVGKSDYDFFPFHRAEIYARSDREVFSSGAARLKRVELAPEPDGSYRLILCSKFPLLQSDGTVIGLACIHHPLTQQSADPGYLGRLADAFKTIHESYGEPLRIRDLACQAQLSPSQFLRCFRGLTGMTPANYLLQVRIDAACQLLIRTHKTTAAIALEVGFFDHSHFTHRFQRLCRRSPSAYRKQHQVPG